MKQTKLIIMAAAAIVSQAAGVQSGGAQVVETNMVKEFYWADVDAVSAATNATGELVYHEFGNRDIIRDSVLELGITNLTGLRLAYDRSADAVVVVSGTNNTVVSTPLTFAGGVTLGNTNGTKIQRLTGVYWENSVVANGTLLAGEWITPADKDHEAAFTLNGQLQFALTGDGTNAPVIYSGSLSTGEAFFTGWDADPLPDRR